MKQNGDVWLSSAGFILVLIISPYIIYKQQTIQAWGIYQVVTGMGDISSGYRHGGYIKWL